MAKMIPSLGYAYTVNMAGTPRRSGGSRWKTKTSGMPSFVAAGAKASTTTTTGSGGSRINVAAEQLRTQLGHLQAEAEATRSKANSARLRLLRFSEAAEKLRRQATVCIQSGKENEARELLLQKKKVMQALDRTKTRIELHDKLSAKLNEAISLKETQLVGNLTLLSEACTVDADRQIHIISPRDDAHENSKESEFVGSPILKLSGTEEVECHSFQADKPMENLQPADEEATRSSFVEGDDKLNFLKKISSFNNFLEHIDGYLGEIEADLLTLLKLSSLVMESEQKQKSLKVQQTLQILEDIYSIRRRIASLIERKKEET